MPRRAAIGAALALLGATLFLAPPLAAQITPQVTSRENPQVARNRAADRRHFTDAEIVQGFLKIAFEAEMTASGSIGRIRKYDGPVRVFVDSRIGPDRRKQAAAIVSDIRAHVEHLDIAMAKQRPDANVVVTLVRDRDLGRTIARLYGREQARRILRSLEPQCLSSFSKDDNFRIQRSDVIIVGDAGDFIFRDCAYEEILQSLGPINDDETVPWTMFNDDVQKGFFGIYDQYLLNILYHPRIRPGMTRDEVLALIPEVLPQVRAFVARVNAISR
ncbi:MAG: DUF2927 domain-containing protein [Pseudorhodoplanes sp.]|nr:DUF2927 domain-containing protein [Pseudorhodoplanes sp.]